MIKIKVVDDCPYTRSGMGVLKLSHYVIGIIAGAVYDKDEWMAFLVGKRSEDGLEVIVDGLEIPEQYRGYGNCELVNKEDLDPQIVGVIHSHHSLGAFFSGTDNKELNPRFPVSIVVAQPKGTASAAEKLLGFEYKVEGRAPLPCKDLGIIAYTVVPNPVPQGWPTTITPGYGTPANSTLRWCPNTTREVQGLVEDCTSACGLKAVDARVAMFGRNGNEFIKNVEKQTKAKTHRHGVQVYPATVEDRRFHKGEYNHEKFGQYEHDPLWEREMWNSWG